MRDPQRIKEIMPLLQAVWEQSPDLRLGQLIVNLVNEIKPTAETSDIYYLEDDKILLAIQKFNERHFCEELKKRLEEDFKNAKKCSCGRRCDAPYGDGNRCLVCGSRPTGETMGMILR